MLRSLWLLGLYLAFLGIGLAAPFVLALGYVWVDTFRPQEVAYIILNQMPVALIMGAAAIAGYFVLDRRAPPPLTGTSVMHIMMAVWSSVTMIWAVAPEGAWTKWDWAFKTLVFSAFIPLVIRSRVQIEAFAQTYLLSLAANFVPFGVKVMLSGGGYGVNLGLQRGNSGLAEGGLLSTACLMAIPLALFLARNSQLMPKTRLTPLAYWGIAGCALLTAIGTYQRSALIGLIAMGAFMIARSKHKVAYGFAGAVVALGLVVASSDRWADRIETITEYQTESSAYTRILVWRWTLNFAVSHPLGGGFQSYLVNNITFPPDALHPGGYIQFGRAFHSIYFEMLGEQGWLGLAMFLAIAATTMLSLHRVARRTRRIPELEWCADFSIAIQSGLVAFMTAGAFVGIAFQPMFWYFVAMGVSLRAYVWRVEKMEAAPKPGWRERTQAAAARPYQQSGVPLAARPGRSHATSPPPAPRSLGTKRF